MDFEAALKPFEERQAPAAATDVVAEPIPAEAAPVEAPAAEAPAATEQSLPTNTPPPAVIPEAAAPAPALDIVAILDEMSAGSIKSIDQLRAVFPRISEYDQLKADRDELAAKMAQAPQFADDEVRILNELKLSGATKEQLNTFKKINEYGSISEMPDREARIARMVMIDGIKPSIAELKVDREFKIGDEDLDETERQILDEDLRIAAMNDKKALEKLKATVSSSNQTPPEELQLQQQAQLLAHQNKVKPFVRDVVASIPNLGSINLNGKDGAEAVTFDIPFDEKAKTFFNTALENFYMDGLTPVTQENTMAALKYARAEYWSANGEAIMRDAYNRGVSITTEQLVNKYENRSGLKPQEERQNVEALSDAAATAKFMADKVNRVG